MATHMMIDLEVAEDTKEAETPNIKKITKATLVKVEKINKSST